MKDDELYPELADYIFGYCGKHFWESERNENRHLNMIFKGDEVNAAMYKVLQRKGWTSADPKVLDLAQNGFEDYKRKLSERIFNEHKHELELNLCPKCEKIARTPKAKQCRFCYYDWH